MDNEEKVRENRYRRMAKRLGYVLKKSKARNWNVDNHQQFMLVNAQFNMVELGQRFDASLDDVAEYLGETEKELKNG